MNFAKLETEMRKYEDAASQVIVPEMHLIARLDGRGFSKLTRNQNFDHPFDENFSNFMVKTTRALMDCGFNIIYGYTESDEISLLFSLQEDSFNRKVRKYNSVLAGEASATFSMLSGVKGVFDCRLIPVPNTQRVLDYFSWRQGDAVRNALNSYCYWTMRNLGISVHKATSTMNRATTEYKIKLLEHYNVDYTQVPDWQSNGIGLEFKEYIKDGFNPITGKTTKTTRRQIAENYHLPTGQSYRDYIKNIMENSTLYN